MSNKKISVRRCPYPLKISIVQLYAVNFSKNPFTKYLDDFAFTFIGKYDRIRRKLSCSFKCLNIPCTRSVVTCLHKIMLTFIM